MSHRNDLEDKIHNRDKNQPIRSPQSDPLRRSARGRLLAFGLCAVLLVVAASAGFLLLPPGDENLRNLTRRTAAQAELVVVELSAPARAMFDMPQDISLDRRGEAVEPAPAAALTVMRQPMTETRSGRLDVARRQATPEAQDPAQLFGQAEAAFADEAWGEALELYTALRAVDKAYAAAQVDDRLTAAYRNAALDLLAAESVTSDSLETAHGYLRAALDRDATDGVATEEYALLTSYLSGVRSLQLEEPGEALTSLLEVHAARPDYLDGLAAQQLYSAYVGMGDVAFRRGETEIARNFYQRAVDLAPIGMEAADVRLKSMHDLLKLTPTAMPKNLATVQASAERLGLPPVLLPTATHASVEEAVGHAEYATAVALTTGTYTPEPESYVTPVLVVPSPPAENVATEAARAVNATARASTVLMPTASPLPYNAVIAEYVYATPVPENAATGEAQAVIAEANALLHGTPTPLPWHAILITRQPTPLPPQPPTNTPLPLVVPASQLTATPTPTPTAIPPDTLPEQLRNKIVFLSDRGGSVQTYALDPATGEVSLITQGWVHPLARKQLSMSPDGKQEAIVLADDNRTLQIQVHSLEYGTIREVTAVSAKENPAAIAYDPAWSPRGNLIAYVSSESSGDEIYTVDYSDRSVRRLTNNAWEWDKHPSWSPDGSQIVFYSNRETGRRQLWIMNADGSAQRNLSSNEYNDWDPIWTR